MIGKSKKNKNHKILYSKHEQSSVKIHELSSVNMNVSP